MKRRTIFNLMIFLIGSLYLHAQNVFDYLPSAQLNNDQQAIHDKLNGKCYLTFNSFVDVNDLSAVQNNGVASIVLPGVAYPIPFKMRNMRTSEDGNYHWYGENIVDPIPPENDTCDTEEPIEHLVGEGVCQEATALINKIDDHYILSIRQDLDNWQVHHLGSGLHALYEVDGACIPELCPMNDAMGDG